MAEAKQPRMSSVKRARLFDEVTDHLRAAILNGEIAPGTRLLQTEVAARLGVSRTPLREAFRILERDGLIRVSNGNKTVEVISLEDEDAVETYQLREMIDGLAASLAAERGLTKQMRNRLLADLDRMEESVRPLAMASYSTAHADFHIGIVEASGNGRLMDLAPIIRISSQMVLSRRQSAAERNGTASPLDRLLLMGNVDHRQIFDAISAGDPALAERAARRHTARTRKSIERLAGFESEDVIV